MDIITVKTSALNYIDNVIVMPGQYENRNLYIGGNKYDYCIYQL